MEQFKLELTITGTADTLRRFQRFLSFFHYNAGHSGLFAMPFDGDGHDRLTVDPPPPEEYRNAAQGIGDSGLELEVAQDNCTVSYKLRHNAVRYVCKDDKSLVREDWFDARVGQENEFFPADYYVTKVCRLPGGERPPGYYQANQNVEVANPEDGFFGGKL